MKCYVASCSFGLLLLPVVAIAQNHDAPKPLPSEPLEKYDNPPAYIYRTEIGPRMILPLGPFVSYQANVDAHGNNILGDAANEPSITVDPTNPNRMAIGGRQVNSVSY